MDLEYRRFALALERPLETGRGSIERREGFLVRVREAGATGFGEASPLPGWTESIGDCEEALERAAEAAEMGGASAALSAVDRTSAARHGVSLALADLRATRAAIPLYRHLGSDERVGRVPVNATVDDGSPVETVEAVREAVDDGFDCCKLKVGVREVDEDVERVRRVREAIGDDVQLRADANGAWDYDEALRAIDAFADLGVALLEQPLPAGALEGHAELRGRGVEIGLDEGLLEHGVEAICDGGAADAVILKPMALGGADVAGQVAAWVSELGIVPIVTTTIDAVVARTGAVHLAASIPDVPACGLATGGFLAEDLGRDPVPFERGRAVVPQAKGLGVSVRWDDA